VDILDELAWRGLIAQTTDEQALREALSAGPVTVYCGFDPTAPSLHHGNLVQLILLRHLQRAGHRVLALVGGATGMIGDPRMSGERVLNSRETVDEWVGRLKTQISSVLDFDGDNPATMVNNLDWTGGLTAIDFLRDVGQHYRLGTMLAKDTVARRLASDEGISFTEFSYQILQGMDFLELYRRHGCTMQTGGNDQWGNLLSGVELVRKADQAAVHALTTPLITKADGTKFGKTEGGAVWLAPDMMTPYAFYQFWVNTDDADVVGLPEDLHLPLARGDRRARDRGRRAAGRSGGAAGTGRRRDDPGARAGRDDKVIAASQALFGRGDLADLDAATLAAAVAELPRAVVSDAGAEIVDLLVAAGLVAGRGAGRRAIAEGGVSVNNVRVQDADADLTDDQLLHGRWAILRRGKRTLAVAERTVRGT